MDHNQNHSFHVIADDSGLEVFALNGEPGVYSARYAGLGKNDEDNIEKLLTNLEDVQDRRAQFVCVISMSAPNEKTKTFKGTVSGVITTCLLYTSPSPRDKRQSRMPSSA